jgi:PAS domain S-box-containing protein
MHDDSGQQNLLMQGQLPFLSPDTDVEKTLSEHISDAEHVKEILQAVKRSAYENLNTIITEWDEKGVIIYANRFALDFFGYTPDELLGRSVYETILRHVDARGADLSKLVRDICADPLQYSYYENENIRKNGELAWIAWTNMPQYDEQGHFVSFLSTGTDITEKRRAEELLRQSESRYRSIVEDQTEFICRSLPDGTILLLNKAYSKFYGEPQNDFVGTKIADFMRTEDKVVIEKAFANMTPDNPIFEWEHRSQNSFGKECWQQWTNRGIFDSSGRLIEIQAVGRDITHRRLAELALQESEARYRTIGEMIPYGIWICDPQGKCTYASQIFLDMLGITFEDAIEFGWSERLKPGTRESTIAAWKACIEAGTNWEYEHIYMDKHGEERYVLARGIAVKNESGEILSWVGVNIDISELKQAQNELRRAHDELEDKVRERTAELTESNEHLKKEIHRRELLSRQLFENEQKFRSIFENSLDAIFFGGADGSIETANPASLNLFEWTEQELRERGRSGVVDPNDSRLPLFLEEREKTGRFRGELNYVKKNGTSFPAEVTVNTFEGMDGKGKACVFIRDVTERKKTEERLRESEERFRMAFEQGTIGMAIVNLDFRFVATNNALSEMTGYPRDELQNLTFMDITHPDDLDLDLANVNMLLTGEIDYYEMEKRYIGKSRNIFWIHLTGSIIRDENRKPLYFLAMVQDISERKRIAELLQERSEELAKTNKDLQQFAYIASHDLQEPLRNITSCMQLLEKRHAESLSEPARQLIDYSVISVKRMRTLLEDLLAYSRVTTKAQSFHIVDASVILEQTLRDLVFAIDESNAIITRDPLPQIFADATQISQVFQNLIKNGIKFKREDPIRIHISAREETDEWIFSVQDNGIGIEDEYFERIFIIFQRLHTRTEYEGTGLGLSIVQRILERHGGRIWLESTIGVGSTFYFALPKYKPEAV